MLRTGDTEISEMWSCPEGALMLMGIFKEITLK